MVWFILNDMSLGMIIQRQEFACGIWEPERYIVTQSYVMGFIKFAEAFHAYAQLFERATEIKDALKNVFTQADPQ